MFCWSRKKSTDTTFTFPRATAKAKSKNIQVDFLRCLSTTKRILEMMDITEPKPALIRNWLHQKCKILDQNQQAMYELCISRMDAWSNRCMTGIPNAIQHHSLQLSFTFTVNVFSDN